MQKKNSNTMKNKKLRKGKNDSAATQFMTLDILENIMLYSDNPGRMGEYLTRQIRELIGARVVILLEVTNEIKDSRQRVIGVQPARYKKLAASSEVERLAAYCYANPQPSVWRIGDSPAEVERILSALGYQTSITIPLLIGTNCVGVLLALDLLDVFAMDKVIQVLESLSGVAALILRNALLYETQEVVIEERTRELSIRNQITNVFLTIPDSEMYVEVLNVILAATESKYGIFGYIDPDGALVCPSLTRNVWDQCRIPAKDIVFPREKWDGIWGRALVEKKTLYSNEPFRVLEGHIPITRALDVPIIHQGEVIGNILVGNKEKDYTDKDAESLEAIAYHIAPILNARLQRDVSENERQQAEKVLHRYKHIVSSSTDMLALLDKRFNYLAANKAYIEAFKLTPEQLIGNTVAKVFGEEFFNTVIKPNADRCLGGEKVNHQNWIDFPAYGRRYMDVNYYPYYSKDKKIIGFVVNGRDISERKQAEEELERHREHLEELVKERTRELGEKNVELERFNKLFIGREFRIKELKEKLRKYES